MLPSIIAMRLMPLLIISIIVTTQQSFAQAFNENSFTRYTTANGLSDNYIRDVTQDSTGYLWIATNKGLNRFDGTTFKLFLKNNRYNPIPDNSIYSMRLFGNDLAIATNEGAQVISTSNLEQTNFLVPTSDVLNYWSNACFYACPDKHGNVCLSTKTGFYVFSKAGKIKHRYDHFTEKDVGQSWMLFGERLYTLPDGNVLQVNNSGLLIYNGKDNKIIRDTISFSPGLKKILKIWKAQRTIFFTVSSSDILIINFENNSLDLINVVTGSSKSFNPCFTLNEEIGWQTKLNFLYNDLWAINSKNKGFFILQIDTLNRTVDCSPSKYFKGHNCNSIFADRQKRLWVATSKGLYMNKIKPDIVRTYKVQGQEENTVVTSLYLTKDKIFLGTANRKIIVLNKHTKKLINSITLPETLIVNNTINQIVPMSRDTVWITMNKEIWWLNTSNLHYNKLPFYQIDDSTNYISFLYRDKTGTVWINSNKINNIYKYHPANNSFEIITQAKHPKLKLNVLNAIVEDKEGNLWMSGDAIAKWNAAKQQIDTLIEYLPTQSSGKKGFIVMADSNGEVWAMVNDDGFARLTGKLLHIRPSNLSFNTTGNLLPSLLNNKVFIPTNDGIGFYDIEISKGVLFNVNDGLPDEVVTSNRFVSDPSNNSIWFACKNIICNLSFSPETYSALAPHLTISELTVNNGDLINYPGESIELKYNQNDLRLLFSGINFTDPENMRYAYRFKGNEDSAWIEAGNQPSIILTNIGSGTYNLQVKVYAYDNKWPEQINEFSITIKPPFWKTTWFIGLAIISLLTFLYYLYKYRVKRIKQKANIDNLLAQTEMKALHAQMNPHFIFNCLNSIREMILQNENMQASKYLSKFAQLIRITLDQSSKPTISLKETIDYLQRYLEMEQIRTDNFKYTLQVDEKLDLEEIKIPPMLIQPFIENAIWHGQSGKQPMDLSLEFFSEGDDLVCVIDDTGVGIEASMQKKNSLRNDHRSVGIDNIKQRIKVLNQKYGTDCRLDIIDKSKLYESSTGTMVTLHFPLHKNLLQT